MVRLKSIFSKIKVLPSFIILVCLIIALGYIEQFFITLLSVTLHECCHIFTARLFGLRVKALTVTPLGQIAEIDGIDLLPLSKKLMVAFSGPLLNFGLFLICLLFLPRLEYFKAVNLALCMFNLVPSLPLDGGRALHILLSRVGGTINASIFLKRISGVLSLLVIAAGFMQVVLFPYNLSLLCLGLFLKHANQAEFLNTVTQFYKMLMSKQSKLALKRLLPVKYYIAEESATSRELISKMSYDNYLIFKVIKKEGKFLTLNEEEIINHALENGFNASIKDLAPSPILPP